ncbi:MAG: lytic transglycosylase domain-containing protein [Sphingobium sp.]
MDMVKLGLAILLFGAVPAHAQTYPDPYSAHIAEAAARFSLPEHWIRAVMRTESAGDPGATSHAGAMGLMQVMPGTYAEMRARYGLGPDPYAVRDNILAGTAYLREMYDRYGSPGFLAAYNAGPGRLDDHLRDGRPLPAETRRYVALIAPRLRGPSTRISSVPAVYEKAPDTIFAVRAQAAAPVAKPLAREQSDSLFVIRRDTREGALPPPDVQQE